jgi:ATP-dependent protease ClpP protease subunit
MPPKNRARVRARADGKKSVTIEIYEVIDSFAWLWGGETAKTVRETLATHEDADEIHVRINTDGGDVSEGIAMMTAWGEHAGRVITHNDGKAFSMGSALLLSGDERRMSRGADIMAHLPWTIAAGTSEDLRDVADLLDSKADDLAGLYAQATGHSREQWMEWLTDTTWWSAEQALSDGLIDEITDTVVTRAQLRADEYPNIPARLLCSAKKPDKRATMPPKKRQDKPEPSPDVAAIKKAERERVSRIRAVGAKLETPEDVITAAIDGDMSVEDFRAAAVEQFAASPPLLPSHGRAEIVPGEDQRDKWCDGVVLALMYRTGLATDAIALASQKGEKYPNAPREFMAHTLLDFGRESLTRAGHSISGLDKMQLAGKSFTVYGSGGSSTRGDFPIALENFIHKAINIEFELTEVTWPRWWTTMPLNDFRPHRMYRFGELGKWEVVNEHGEYRNMVIPDAVREQVQADKYGNIIAFTREMMIDDDMGAVEHYVRAFARAGAFTPEWAAFDLLAENGGLGPNLQDGNPLYDASRNNIGTSSVMSVAGLDADRTQFKKQTADTAPGERKRYLRLNPRIMLVPTELKSRADQINGSQWDIDAFDTNLANGFQVPNRVAGQFTDIVDAPELSDVSTTRRYTIDSVRNSPFVMGFLNNQRTPTIESREGWRIDGVEYKGRFEFGLGVRDYKTTQTNAGT